MDDYRAAQLQKEVDELSDVEKKELWYETPFEHMWLGLKWAFALFLFIGIAHDMVKYFIDNWGK